MRGIRCNGETELSGVVKQCVSGGFSGWIRCIKLVSSISLVGYSGGLDSIMSLECGGWEVVCM